MPVSPTPESPREVPRKRKLRPRFDDDPRWIIQCLLSTLKPLSNLSRSIPLQYVTAFLVVALDEGRAVGHYARALDMHRWTMSRYLNAIGPRGRNGGPGLDLVTIKHDPYDPRWTEVFLTSKGRAVADEVFKQMRRASQKGASPVS
jgi:DNA-binding MarR family transcriptional regulator